MRSKRIIFTILVSLITGFAISLLSYQVVSHIDENRPLTSEEAAEACSNDTVGACLLTRYEKLEKRGFPISYHFEDELSVAREQRFDTLKFALNSAVLATITSIFLLGYQILQIKQKQ